MDILGILLAIVLVVVIVAVAAAGGSGDSSNARTQRTTRLPGRRVMVRKGESGHCYRVNRYGEVFEER